MKKFAASVLLCSVFAMPALAQTTVESQILKIVKENFVLPVLTLNDDVKIQKTATGYDVTIPNGTFAGDKTKEIPAQTIRLTDAGKFENYAQYEISFSDLNQFNPALVELLAEANTDVQGFSYKLILVPELEITPVQTASIKELTVKNEDKTGTIFSFKNLNQRVNLTAKPDHKADGEGGAVIEKIFLNHPMLSAEVGELKTLYSFTGMPLGKDTLTRMFEINTAKLSVALTDVKLASFFMPFKEASFNSLVTIGYQADPNTQAAQVSFVWDVSKIKVNMPDAPYKDKIPTQMSGSASFTGFTVADVSNYAMMRQKAETAMADTTLSEEARMQTIRDAAAALESVVNKTTLTYSQVGIKADNYVLETSGTMDLGKETAKGVLKVTNFDVVSPPAQPVDEAVCGAATERLNDLIQGGKEPMEVLSVEFERVSKVCDDHAGPLEFMRPYMAKARTSVNAAGLPVVEFEYELKDNNFFVNGKKVGDDVPDTLEKTTKVDEIAD